MANSAAIRSKTSMAIGDAFTVRSFAFRTVAGLFFSGLYVLRGFGITAWTHALYDVAVLL